MLFRLYNVVECKWTESKPWVIFSSNRSIHPKACICQSISSRLGESVLWHICDNTDLYNTSYFITPESPGFGGRQAFSAGKDLFYNAMQSVISVSNLLVKKYDSLEKGNLFALPKYGAIAFPMIVIKGPLFNAFYNQDEDKIDLSQVSHIRLHWRGSESWDLHSTVDIVVSDYLDEFLSIRSEDTNILLRSIDLALINITECFEKRSLNAHSLKMYHLMKISHRYFK